MHIHIPDGVMPPWLLLFGAIFSLIFLALSIYSIKKKPKNVPLIGVFAALSLVLMNIPLGPLPYHMNLTVLIAILIGIAPAFVAFFVSNLFLSLMGHGGITVIGLNSIILGFEVFLGYYLYKLPFIKNIEIKAALSTLITLCVSLMLFVAIVFASGLNPAEFSHQEHEEVEHENDWVSLDVFVALTAPIALVGAIIESIITFFAVIYIKKVRPVMLKND